MHTIKEMQKDQRPYERARTYGPATLTDVELLAVMLRTGTKDISVLELSSKILNMPYSPKGLHSLLHRSYEEYMDIKGVGSVKAVQLLCLSELCKRIWSRQVSSNQIAFKSPQIVADYYMERIRHLDHEELRLVYMDTRQRLVADSVVSLGTVNASLISVREVLIDALKHKAVNMIMIHNHPSGNPSPSQDDIRITQIMLRGCEIVGINLSDHIIIGDNSYYSFREQGAI